MRKIYRAVKRKVFRWLEFSGSGLRMSLRIRYGGARPRRHPDAPWHNAVLKSKDEVERAVSQVCELGLPLMQDLPKNWDSLAALDLILKCTDKDARIFDAGGEIYSMILPWLFLYGYRNLSVGNLTFRRTVKRGPIVYRRSDITRTGLNPETYDAITCLSVIEHGVDLRSYFCEMSRILKPGGVLITSADYFETQVDTRGRTAYGMPIHIFTKEEISEALEIAAQFGLTLTSPLDLGAEEKVVYWKRFDLHYTFVIFSLRKTANV